MTSIKKAKGKKGNFKKSGKHVVAPTKKPKARRSKCFYCKGTGYWKRNCPKYLVDKKSSNVKGIFDIHITNVFLSEKTHAACGMNTTK
jgi:hypothetical protein